MPIRMMRDPDDWPIRYIAVSSDVTREDLRAWLDDQPAGLRLTVETGPGALSSREIRDVAEPRVEKLEIRLPEQDA